MTDPKSQTVLDSAVLVVARAGLVAIFVITGFEKIFGIEQFGGMLAKLGVPFAHVAPYVAILIELVGGLVFFCGIQVRLLAVLFAIYTMVTAFIAHEYWTMADAAARTANEFQFWKNIGITGGFLAMYVTGGGRFSVDALLKRVP